MKLWSLTDWRSNPVTHLDVLSSLLLTLQYIGCWPSGRLALRPTPTNDHNPNTYATSTSRGDSERGIPTTNIITINSSFLVFILLYLTCSKPYQYLLLLWSFFCIFLLFPVTCSCFEETERRAKRLPNLSGRHHYQLQAPARLPCPRARHCTLLGQHSKSAQGWHQTRLQNCKTVTGLKDQVCGSITSNVFHSNICIQKYLIHNHYLSL